MPDTEPIHKINIYENEEEQVILPAQKSEGSGNAKYIPAEYVEAFYSFGEVRFNIQFFKCLSKHKIPIYIFNYYGKYRFIFAC